MPVNLQVYTLDLLLVVLNLVLEYESSVMALMLMARYYGRNIWPDRAKSALRAGEENRIFVKKN
jgi:hypothetical protein